MHPIEIIVRHFQNVFKRNWIASFWNCSKTFPKCVLVEIQLHCAENIVRNFQICLSRNSIASYLKYSKTFSTCVLAEIPLHPIETNFKPFHFVCYQKIICVVPKFFWDTLKLYHDRNSIASYRNYSKTLLNCLLTEFQLQCTKNLERQFQNVSEAKLNCILLKFFSDIFSFCHSLS